MLDRFRYIFLALAALILAVVGWILGIPTGGKIALAILILWFGVILYWCYGPVGEDDHDE